MQSPCRIHHFATAEDSEMNWRAAHTTATNQWRLFLLASQVEVVSDFIVARAPTSFKFVQFVSNFISVAAAQKIRKLLIFLRWLCQTLLSTHSVTGLKKK
jgi:hypothetical protein